MSNEQLDDRRHCFLEVCSCINNTAPFKYSHLIKQIYLKRSTTLEDIYRHYEQPQNKESGEESADDHEHEEEEDYSNHLVGYAYAQQPVAPSKLGYGDSGGSYHSGGGDAVGGYHYPSTGASYTGSAGHSGHGGYGYSSYGGGYGSTGVSGYTGAGQSLIFFGKSKFCNRYS